MRIEIAQLGTLDTRPDARDTLHFQLTLRLLARALLRDLARRLPGFANSRPAFLRENVLRGPGDLAVFTHLQVHSAPNKTDGTTNGQVRRDVIGNRNDHVAQADFRANI